MPCLLTPARRGGGFADDLPEHVLAGPRLELPHRSYLLFRGPLQAARHIGHQITESWFAPQSPSLP